LTTSDRGFDDTLQNGGNQPADAHFWIGGQPGTGTVLSRAARDGLATSGGDIKKSSIGLKSPILGRFLDKEV
jgi:hypothetical protein